MAKPKRLSELSAEEREAASLKYKLIEPYLNKETTLKQIAEQNNISKRTLSYWIKKYRDGGLVNLARNSRSDKGKPRKFNSDLQVAVESMFLSKPKPSCKTIHNCIKKYCRKEKVSVPSYRTICNIVHKIPEDLITFSHEGTRQYQQKYDLLHLRESKNPNEIWQADHVLMDIQVLSAKGLPQRPWLTVIMDDCSRAICGYELSFLAPSSQKTSLCLRHAIWRKQNPRWSIMGIPNTLYTDHGSDFTSKHIEQVCLALKIKLIFSQIGQPRGRGKIERFFRTLNQQFISSIVFNSKIQQSSQLDLKQLNELVYKFIVEYNNRVHSELGATPVNRWQRDKFLPNMPNSLEELDLLLLTEAKPRMVQRDGIHFQGLRYMDIVLARYVRERVVIRYSPNDITSIRAFYKGQFLCQPVCQELSSKTIGLKDIQAARRKRRKELKQQLIKRKSLIEAIIDTGASPLSYNEESHIHESIKNSNKLKIYENE